MSPEMSTDPFVPGPRCHVAGAASGPLAGLTFAVKDLIDVAATPPAAAILTGLASTPHRKSTPGLCRRCWTRAPP